MCSNNRQCILFFTKWPQAGQVKTRLSKDIGAERGTRLYALFVEDLAQTLKRSDAQIICCFHPAEREEAFRRWLGSRFRYLPQEGQGLGERLEHAFVHAYSLGYDRVVVIGSDSPDLPTSLLDRALESLVRHDAVIGPSDDGGYYLIGFHVNTFCLSVFRHIEWSTEHVFEQTLRHLNETEATLQVLPQWQDVDTGRDLDRLVRRNTDTPFAASKTFGYCRNQGWDRPGREASSACR